ncbi:Aste57867_10293 [Aphanomyces stellatus]|uniref:Aste57867_10293 protein n=1 Tax=Aphanomyces stellatus TaxID=120398 RepID=A0A485KQM8_9STRA|nr:hypothetical protein As57867_010253 [Aphanomyces stellatus]VFT87167.1 Aste57867_10293 [Aphanomyces stellatus]
MIGLWVHDNGARVGIAKSLSPTAWMELQHSSALPPSATADLPPLDADVPSRADVPPIQPSSVVLEVPETPLDDIDDQRLLLEDGYAWDYTLVFPTPDHLATNSPLDHVLTRLYFKKALTTPTVEEICHRLRLAGLQIKMVPSAHHMHCLVRASRDRLAYEADRIHLNMLMDKHLLREVSLAGVVDYHIAPFPIEDTLHQYRLSPYESIHFKYSCRMDLQPLYVKQGPRGSLFTSSQRILLLESIMTDRHGGAGLDLDKLNHVNVLTTLFPLHDAAEKACLSAVWLAWRHWWPWEQPLDAIQSYFGPRIGLYFAFLGAYTTWLMAAGAVGPLLWFVGWVYPDASHVIILSASVLVVVWAACFLKSWRRSTARLALQWGTSDFHAIEQVRAQYVGTAMASPVHGQPMLFFHRREKLRRRLATWLALVGLMAAVVAVVATIFYLQYLMLQRGYSIHVGGADVSLASPITSLANVVQIKLMYVVYGSVCEAMNDFENHRTESTYEGAFILKSVLFYVVNNFAGLFYITFVKGHVGLRCANDDCVGELRLYLLMIFGIQLANGLFQDLVLSRLRVCYGRRRRHDDPAAVAAWPTTMPSHPAESQFYLLECGWRVTFNGYLTLAMQFGYTVLFVGAAPFMPLFTMIINLVEMKTDASTLLSNFRRPVPRQASTIGRWIAVLECLTTLAIATNGFVVVYSSNVLNTDLTDPNAGFVKLRAFVLYVAALVGFRYCVAAWVPDMPHNVDVQLKRQAFLTSKIYAREADDAVPVYESTGSVRLLGLSPASSV